jgi:hypothetical protein
LDAAKDELEKIGKEIHELRIEIARVRVTKITRDEEHARAMDDLRQANEAKVTVAEGHANTVKMMGAEVKTLQAELETLRRVGAFMSFGRVFSDIILCQSSGAEAARVKDEEHANTMKMMGEEIKTLKAELETLRQVGAFMGFGRGFSDILLCQSSGAGAMRVDDEEHAKAIRLVEVCVFLFYDVTCVEYVCFFSQENFAADIKAKDEKIQLLEFSCQKLKEDLVEAKWIEDNLKVINADHLVLEEDLTSEMNAKDVMLETMRTEIESQKLVLAGEEVHVAKCAEVLGNAKAAEV